MGNIWVEVCLISARGLRRSSSLWKLQWYAVGWIDPNNKYCTKISAAGNANPVWKTKFATLVNDSKFQDMALHVEIYSREPFFLREKLQGTATVALKEFLMKHSKNSGASGSVPSTRETGSYQLHKKNSGKPQGFVDISILISKERERPSSYPEDEAGFLPMDHSNNITLSTEEGSWQAYSTGSARLSSAPVHQPQINFPYTHPMPYPINYSTPSVGGASCLSTGGASCRPPQTPPPPRPSNAGYISTFLPRAETYVNMPSQAAPVRGPSPGFGVGVGAGALAAGALIFGDDFMSGFEIPAGSQDVSLTISTDQPF